ncbi:MAG: ABC transporter permease subunit [Thermaerobacter sp.]|nr:ABC transporter permease subunit [Thermaerobacter sp.]
MTAHSRRLRTDRRQQVLLGAAAGLYAAVGLGVLLMLLVSSGPLLLRVGVWQALLGVHWNPLAGQFGLVPFMSGTLLVTALAILLALPLAMALAVVGARVLRGTGPSLMTRGLTVLAAVPSVIYGWWGLTTVVPVVRRWSGGPGFSLASAGIVLALMILPTLAVLFQDALTRVPPTWQEGSLALGATDDQTLVRLIWPAARANLFRAMLVAVARALGETMAVQMVIGGQTIWQLNLLRPGATLTTQILTDLAVFPPGTAGYRALAVMALLLMAGMYMLVRISERWERTP